MPAIAATTTRRKLVLTEIVAIVLAIDVVAALLLGAPVWVPVVLAVLAVDAAGYALWQLRALRAQERATTRRDPRVTTAAA